MIASPKEQLTLDQRCFLFICTEGSLSWVWKIWREAKAGKPEEESFCAASLTSSIFDEWGYSVVGLLDQAWKSKDLRFHPLPEIHKGCSALMISPSILAIFSC